MLLSHQGWTQTPKEIMESHISRALRSAEEDIAAAESLEKEATMARENARAWRDQAEKIRAALETLRSAE